MRDQTIVRSYRAGVQWSEIGWSASMIGRALKRHNVKPCRKSPRVVRPPRTAWWADVRALHEEGKPIKAIARELGRTRRPVQYALTAMGLRP
jgi:DNA-binding NarL/FixJ family response regulator